MACRQVRPKDELVRIVRGADGTVAVDATGAASGRGAYLCGAAACLERGLKRERLSRAFRMPSRSGAGLERMIDAVARARRTTRRVPVE